jgi:hypothetical protein
METFYSQVFSSLPIGIAILLYLSVLNQKIADLCRKVDRLDRILINHITNHPHCPGPDDDEDDEEEEE